MIRECVAAIMEAAPHLLQDQAEAIDDAIHQFKKRRQAAGSIDIEAETIAFAREQQDMVRANALIEKRNRAINIMREQERLAYYRAGGDRASERVWASLTGSQRSFFGAADSVQARENGITADLLGTLLKDLKGAGLLQAMKRRTPGFDRDVANELANITDPVFGRSTGNKQARRAAEIIDAQQERARGMLNDAGAWIGKLPGWIVRQSHDEYKIAKAGRDEWKATILPLLDEKALAEIADVDQFLNGVWVNLASGNHLSVDGVASAKDPAFKGPGNLGKRVSQERVLKFRNADAWFDYNERFGTSSVLEAAIHGLDRSARNIALMRRFGTNPEMAFRNDLDRLMIEAKDRGDIAEEKRLSGNSLRSTFDTLMGTNSIPGNMTLARHGSIGRAWFNMTSLGGVVLSSFSDTAVRASVLRHNGIGLLERWGTTFEGFLPSKGKRAVADEIAAGVRGALGSVVSRFAATDNIPGRIAKIQDTYFRLTGLTKWTDAMKDGVGIILSRQLARDRTKGFDALHPFLKRNLERYGFDAERWDVIRKTEMKADDGEMYLTSDAIEALPDEAFDGLIRSRMEAEIRAGGDPETVRARLTREARQDLSTGLQSYYVDQANEAMNEPTAYERALLTGGVQRGTPWGEGIRFLTQFKSFPTTFVTRQLGREFLRGAGSGEGYGRDALRTLDKSGLAQLIVASTIMGYIAMTAKDAARGRKPRDPNLPATWGAAFVQGGGAGIYGDFLMGEYNRFGGGFLETMAGPGFGTASNVARIFSSIRDGESFSGTTFQTVKSLTPGANLFYTRMALDYLIFFQIQEALSPGSLKRMERRIDKEQGQEYLFKRPSEAVPRGGGNRILEGVR